MRILHLLSDTIGFFLHGLVNLAGWDWFIETWPDGPPTFSKADHGNGDREYWGLGLHLVVSDLRVVRPRSI